MTIEELIIYINDKIDDINRKFPNLISNTQRENYIKSNTNIEMTPDEINEKVKEIDTLYEEIIKLQEKQREQTDNIEYSPDELDTKLKTNSQGIYLSSLMTSALALINCSKIDEINKWIDSIPNLYMISPIEATNYSNEQIESIKRNLFEMYQDSMICTEVVNAINAESKEEAMRYALHKKLIGLNLSIEDEIHLGNIGLSEGLPVLYKEIEKICLKKYGQEKGNKIYKKIIYYFTTDYENFNSSTYEQMQVLNEKIKANIKKCNESGGNFQLVICSIGYKNNVSKQLNDNGDIFYSYNYDTSNIGQELAEKLGASYRLRSLINRNAAEEMIEAGFTKADKELVVQILKESLTSSLQNYNDNIKDDQKVKSFELFNELVEIQKEDRDYKCIWEEKFGISLKDIVERIITPNMQIIQELKSKNVEFMYNETLLQESPEKRAKVKETIEELQKLAPGLITVFGDQDHTFSSDYNEDKIDQLKETAQFDKEIAQLVIEKDSNGNDIKLKVECSERDLYFSKNDLISFVQRGISKDDILKYKQSLLNRHDEIYGDVPFQRECEWTVLDNISGDYFKNGMQPDQESYIGKYTKISNIARKDNSQRINQDITDFNNWKSTIIQHFEQQKPTSFAQRSQSEIKIHNQIKEKNQIIKQQKAQQKQANKPKVKTLTQSSPNGNNSNSSKGFANTITLSLIASFVAGALFMIVYILIRG